MLSQRMIIHSLICFAISFFYTTYSNIYCTSEWKKEWMNLPPCFHIQRMIISSSASFEGLVLDSFNGDLLNEPYLRCNFSSTTSIKSTNLLLIPSFDSFLVVHTVVTEDMYGIYYTMHLYVWYISLKCDISPQINQNCPLNSKYPSFVRFPFTFKYYCRRTKIFT